MALLVLGLLLFLGAGLAGAARRKRALAVPQTEARVRLDTRQKRTKKS